MASAGTANGFAAEVDELGKLCRFFLFFRRSNCRFFEGEGGLEPLASGFWNARIGLNLRGGHDFRAIISDGYEPFRTDITAVFSTDGGLSSLVRDAWFLGLRLVGPRLSEL